MRLIFIARNSRRVWHAGMAIAALGCGLLLHAQSTQSGARRAPTPGTAVSGMFRIAGKLVNAVTGEPVRQATVAVLALEDSHTIESAISDGEGHFALEGLPAAKYQLTASKRGFRTAFYDEHDEFSSAVVTGADQDTGHLTFRLTAGASVRGVVSSDDGDPVEGARVLLFQRPKHPGPGQRTTQADAAVTDDTGAYEFTDLAAGEYLIAVVAEPWYAMHGAQGGGRAKLASDVLASEVVVNPALDVAYPVTYYDSTTDEAAARPIVLSGGSREVADISLHAVPALRLSVPIPRRPNGSIMRAELQQTVLGTSISADSTGYLESLQTGTAEMSGIAPGHYQLTEGNPPRVVDLDLSASQEVDGSAGVPASVVAGTLRFANGMPVPEEVNLTLDRVDERGVNQMVTVAHGGRFRFENVPPGSWLLWAVGSKPFTVVATSIGNQQRAGNIVTTRDRPLEVAVTLSANETRIEGLAEKDGKGLAGVMVVLAPKDPGAWRALIRRDQSDTDGSFALRDVAPGQYTAVAIEDGWPLDWSQPEAMARYLQQGTAVSVTANSGGLLRLPAPIQVQAR
jgi:Carboxypeptidase regulatory-like domain